MSKIPIRNAKVLQLCFRPCQLLFRLTKKGATVLFVAPLRDYTWNEFTAEVTRGRVDCRCDLA